MYGLELLKSHHIDMLKYISASLAMVLAAETMFTELNQPHFQFDSSLIHINLIVRVNFEVFHREKN